MRLDKWLWCARFFKTRGLAQKAIEKGHVSVNGQRPKASREIAVGDVLFIRQEHEAKTVSVCALSERRGSAAESRDWYNESEESRLLRESEKEKRKAEQLSQPQYGHRPDKRERRQLLDLLAQDKSTQGNLEQDNSEQDNSEQDNAWR